jgi:hypothetical protein
MKTATPNFDCPDIYEEHGYLVRLTKGRTAKVQILEVFGRPPTEREAKWSPDTFLRCEASSVTWGVIAPELRSEFNRRLKAERKPVGRWGADETAVQRLLGKELLVLLWAVEMTDVSEEETEVAIRNWIGLKPEERWWLYTMTAAATGLAHQRGMGWRGALRQALCFGTRTDVFQLAVVTGRGALHPRDNAAYKSGEVEKEREREMKSSTIAPGLIRSLPTW